MPKLIDYPRTTYAGAWELTEIVDDTGGKCAIETAARKLNRKVSGSFKAIIGSAVKFGLLTSKRDLLTTTTLFKRIKHAYDKSEELLFHREAFLTPPLFTQLCRKFRSRELPVQMLDVMLIREFTVEEINAPGVAKAFVDGCRMVGLLDEHNMVADIDALSARNAPRRELASPQPTTNSLRQHEEDTPKYSNNLVGSSKNLAAPEPNETDNFERFSDDLTEVAANATKRVPNRRPASTEPIGNNPDAIANLFGLLPTTPTNENLSQSNQTHYESDSLTIHTDIPLIDSSPTNGSNSNAINLQSTSKQPTESFSAVSNPTSYHIQISGAGLNTTLSITENEDIDLAISLLEKIRRQLKLSLGVGSRVDSD